MVILAGTLTRTHYHRQNKSTNLSNYCVFLVPSVGIIPVRTKEHTHLCSCVSVSSLQSSDCGLLHTLSAPRGKRAAGEESVGKNTHSPETAALQVNLHPPPPLLSHVCSDTFQYSACSNHRCHGISVLDLQQEVSLTTVLQVTIN